MLSETIYIKIRMFLIIDRTFWDKYFYYREIKNKSLKESYVRAKYMSGSPDFIFGAGEYK